MSGKPGSKGSGDGATPPRQFRLGAETLADLDAIAAHYGAASRTDAVRIAARREADRIRKKEKGS